MDTNITVFGSFAEAFIVSDLEPNNAGVPQCSVCPSALFRFHMPLWLLFAPMLNLKILHPLLTYDEVESKIYSHIIINQFWIGKTKIFSA